MEGPLIKCAAQAMLSFLPGVLVNRGDMDVNDIEQ